MKINSKKPLYKGEFLKGGTLSIAKLIEERALPVDKSLFQFFISDRNLIMMLSVLYSFAELVLNIGQVVTPLKKVTPHSV